MAKCKMQRIEIAALLSDSKRIVERLQRRGVVEICDNSDEKLVRVSTQATIAVFEKNLNLAVQAREILAKYLPAKASLLDSLKGKREISTDAFGRQADEADRLMKKCYEIAALEKQIHDASEEIVRLRTQMDALEPWRKLDMALAPLATRRTRCFAGSLPGVHSAEELADRLHEADGTLTAVEIEVVFTSKEQTCLWVICLDDIAQQVEEALREMGFARPSDPAKETPEQRIRAMQLRTGECEDTIEKARKAIEAFAGSERELEFLIDYFTMRKEKYEMIGRLGMTKNTVIINGYIPQKAVDRLGQELESRYPVAITVSEPDQDEDVPVLLENNGFSSPVEPITEMYALPAKKDIDPTPVMAVFYYLFFGLMLSDAGYGCLMVLVSAIALKKFQLEGNMRKTMKMFLYSGVSTIFWGALFGTWFGDIVPVICKNFLHKPAPRMAIWFDPVSDPMKLLLFSLGLGILHLFLGLGVHFYQLWKAGKRFDAFCDVVPIYLLVLGAAPVGAGMLTEVPAIFNTIGMYVLLAGVILIILTAGRTSKNIFARLGSGLYGLYNAASGYLSDVLSYSRLLALGLATGVIGQVVNLLGTIPENPIVKGILLFFVFIVGHTLNMAINMLGAYVHTNRLQYVELFSKFYEGGGRPFQPFAVHTKYVKFKEEAHHE